MKKNNLFIGIILSALVSNTTFGMYPPATVGSFFSRMSNIFSWKNTKKACPDPFGCCKRKYREAKQDINTMLDNGETRVSNLVNNTLNNVEIRVNNLVDNALNNAEPRINNIVNNAGNQIHGNIAQDNFNTLIWMGVFGTAAIVTTYYLTTYLCKYLEKKVSHKERPKPTNNKK